MHVVDAALKARDQEWRLLRQMSTLMMGHDFLSSLCDNSVKDSLKILVWDIRSERVRTCDSRISCCRYERGKICVCGLFWQPENTPRTLLQYSWMCVKLAYIGHLEYACQDFPCSGMMELMLASCLRDVAMPLSRTHVNSGLQPSQLKLCVSTPPSARSIEFMDIGCEINGFLSSCPMRYWFVRKDSFVLWVLWIIYMTLSPLPLVCSLRFSIPGVLEVRNGRSTSHKHKRWWEKGERSLNHLTHDDR